FMHGSTIVASGGPGSISNNWPAQPVGGQLVLPPLTSDIRIRLVSHLTSGWVAFDDVELYPTGSSTNLLGKDGVGGFEAGSGGGWSAVADPDFPATSIWRGTWGTAAPRSGSYAYVISNQAYGYLYTDPIDNVQPNTDYSLE